MDASSLASAATKTEMSWRETEEVMRAIDCPCGHRLEATDDDELFRLAREHVDRDHPEMQRSDEELRARIAADAYNA